MGSLKALTLAGGVAIAAATAAHAADLPAPPPMPAPVVMPILETSGWYLRGDVGVGTSEATKLRQSFDPSMSIPGGVSIDYARLGDHAFAGVGAGYKLNSWFRFDVTGEYRTATEWRAVASWSNQWCGTPTGRCYDNYTGRISNAVFLANAYFDLGTYAGLTPFIGVGIGTNRYRFAGLTDADYQMGSYGMARDRSAWNFAWALMAGLSYDVTQNVKLELGYRYLNMGTARSNPIICNVTGGCSFEVQRVKLASHDIRVGMRWMLSQPDAPAPAAYFPAPAPLRSKF
jgi:opacity protein-like surface antigen